MTTQELLQYAVPAGLFGAMFLWKRVGQIDSIKAKALLEAGGLLVDVRTASEFANGHIPGAKNIPLTDLANKSASLKDKNQTLVLYCASGTRSAMARSTLKKLGYSQVFNLGSMSNWKP
jgi:phage shock protein E